MNEAESPWVIAVSVAMMGVVLLVGSLALEGLKAKAGERNAEIAQCADIGGQLIYTPADGCVCVQVLSP